MGAVLLVSCAAHGPSVNEATQTADANFCSEWQRQWRYVTAIDPEKGYEPKRFLEALAYFEKTTGVRTEVPLTGLGPVVDLQRVRSSCEEWHRWCTTQHSVECCLEPTWEAQRSGTMGRP